LLWALLLTTPTVAQTPLPAIDINAAEIQAFLKALPRDAVSDRPIRVVDVGGYKVGTYGVFRPKTAKQEAILHQTKVSEIYYMLEGAATLVTGGALAQPTHETQGFSGTSVRSTRIEGGVTRRVKPGDVVIIPGGTPHWWSALDGDIAYLIFRPDPEGKQQIK
jgi:hypothetical protein